MGIREECAVRWQSGRQAKKAEGRVDMEPRSFWVRGKGLSVIGYSVFKNVISYSQGSEDQDCITLAIIPLTCPVDRDGLSR
jgi:hypothetical protein